MLVIECYLERENYKALKFEMNNSSYFEISVYFFLVPHPNKRRT